MSIVATSTAKFSAVGSLRSNLPSWNHPYAASATSPMRSSRISIPSPCWPAARRKRPMSPVCLAGLSFWSARTMASPEIFALAPAVSPCHAAAAFGADLPRTLPSKGIAAPTFSVVNSLACPKMASTIMRPWLCRASPVSEPVRSRAATILPSCSVTPMP